MYKAEARFFGPLYSWVPVTRQKDYPPGHMASIHKSKRTLPACSGSAAPVSQSNGTVLLAETQRLPAALFITTDPRPVSGHVKDTHRHAGPFSVCIKKHAVSPVQENKNRWLEILPLHPCMPSLFIPCSLFPLWPPPPPPCPPLPSMSLSAPPELNLLQACLH